MTRLSSPVDIGAASDSDDTRSMVRRVLRARGVWDDFVHWNSIWSLMPEVAYRLGRCIPTSVPDAKGRGPLLGQCFVEGAAVIRRWPASDMTMVLIADALRAMFTRALDAAECVVILPGGREWRPDVHGPLADCLSELGTSVATVHRREGDTVEARAAMHRLFDRYVYCMRCSINLRQSYGQLMGAVGDF